MHSVRVAQFCAVEDKDKGHTSLSTNTLEPEPGDMIHDPQLVYDRTQKSALLKRKRSADRIDQKAQPGGRLLLAAFALDEARVVLLILDEYCEANSDLNISIFFKEIDMCHHSMHVCQTHVVQQHDERL